MSNPGPHFTCLGMKGRNLCSAFTSQEAFPIVLELPSVHCQTLSGTFLTSLFRADPCGTAQWVKQ